MTISTIDIGRRIYSNITGGKAIIVLPLFFYRNQKGADKIEYSKPSLVAMAHARTIATFFVAVCPAKLDHTSRCKSGHGNRQ